MMTGSTRLYRSSILISVAIGAAGSALAQTQEDAAALGKQLNNPVSSLISVPFQLNYNTNIGEDDSGTSYTLLLEPVIPISLNEDWNLISRTILPFQWTESIPMDAGGDFGIGDITQSFFFSPKESVNGFTWGVGPVFLLPTSRSNDKESRPIFGQSEWGGGLTGVGLKQSNSWTFGALVNHIWDIDGDTDISQTYLQPFIVYTTDTAWSFALNTESTYNWEADDEDQAWSVPINAMISKVVHFGKQPVSFQGGARYWAQSPDGGPEDWGARLAVTFLFPK